MVGPQIARHYQDDSRQEIDDGSVPRNAGAVGDILYW